MADPFAIDDPLAPAPKRRRPDKGVFMSVLDYLDEIPQIPKNMLRGNPAAAGRHLANIWGDAVDAFLPGDWIPDFRQEGDDVSSAALLGIDEKAHPILGGAANLIGDTLLNPVTYIPGGLVAKGIGAAGKVAATGISKLPQGEKVLEGVAKAGQVLRSTIGAQRLSPRVQNILQTARAAGSNESRAGLAAAKGALGGLADNELNIVSDVIDNLRWEGGKPVARLAEDTVPALQRVDLHPEITPENAERIRAAVAKTLEIGESQAQRPNIFKTVTGADGKPIEMNPEYLQRQWTGMTDVDRELQALGNPSAIKGRTLKTPEDVIGALADPENAGIAFERNSLKRLAGRAEEQGKLTQRAEIGKAILGDEFAYADDALRGQVENAIKELPAEEAQVLLDSFKGMPGRSAPMQALASMNRYFKPIAVYGAFVPKLGAVVRNKVSGIWQTLSNPASRSVTGPQAARTVSDLIGGIDDGIAHVLGKRFTGSELTKSIDQVEAAFAASGGSAERAIGMLPPELGEAVRNGVLDTFVSSEQLVKDMASTGWKKQFGNIMNWPGKIFGGVESRMRLGMYMDLVKTGKVPAEAAQIVKDSLFDYSISSVANRRARDFIPFFQYTAKAVPQQAKFLAEKPFVAAGLASALGGDDGDPVYPYMEGRLNIPIGSDEQGNNQYISGLGLPFEALNTIPNPSGSLASFGRQAEQNLVGQLQPALKSTFAALSGEDPYFGTPYGSYQKVPLLGEAGKLGGAYNQLAGTGLIQPLDSPARFIDKLLDDRKSAGTRALDTLTGANVVSVDPIRALQQQLQQQLEADPSIAQHRSFYDKSKDPQTQALIKAFNEAKKKAKEKRKAQP